VKVRILDTPLETDLEGLKLDNFVRGTIKDVSPAVASWLITQGYAALEMRQLPDRRESREPRDSALDRRARNR
jgi:hypothetical protein